MIPIATEKRIDWNAVKADYIGGDISQRDLAAKYGIPVGTLLKRANKEGWAQARERAGNDAVTKAVERTAEAAADNATLAEDFKRKMLLRLMRVEAKFPMDATEIRTRKGDSTATFKLTDLTRAYRDLTDDMPKATSGEDALAHAREILGGVDSAIK